MNKSIFQNILRVLTAAFLVYSKTSSLNAASKSRSVMFVGVDISGSFLRGKNFDDAMKFTANYIYSHLNGYGDLLIPGELFVGSIGGAKANEPKTFFPIEIFENKSVDAIEDELKKIFPKTKSNPLTDFNSYFTQVSETVKIRNLHNRPISIVLLSDGIPDTADGKKSDDYAAIKLAPLEDLARNITVRLLYTTAVVAARWVKEIPRTRVRVWTQDDEVMTRWKDTTILVPNVPIAKQEKFFAWLRENVDFPVRPRQVSPPKLTTKNP